ncbi:MAG: hypothetical protein V3U35_03175 [Candidatus Neomarinimicrobiota bacterium]
MPALAAGLVLTSPLGGQASFDWLSDAVHARGMALASADVATANPWEALGLNPASLERPAWQAQSKLGLLVVLRRYPAGIDQQMTQVLMPLGRSVAGLEIRRLDYGTFSGYDDAGLQGEDYRAEDLLVRGGLMRPVGRFLALGAAAGGIMGNLAGERSRGFLWSLGARLNVQRLDAQIGAVLQNQGTLVNEVNEAASGAPPDQLPGAWLVGLAKGLAYLPVTVHIAGGREMATGQPLWRLGIEFRLTRLALRMGVDQGKNDYARGNASADLLSGFSLGIGTRTGGLGLASVADTRRSPRFSLDGAVKLLGPLGFSTSLALAVQL